MINLNEFVKNSMFLKSVQEAKKVKPEKDVAAEFGFTTVGLRKEISRANFENRCFLRELALTMKRDGKTDWYIGTILGKNESSVRLLLDEELSIKIENKVKERLKDLKRA